MDGQQSPLGPEPTASPPAGEATVHQPPVPFDWFAALLSYLVPGMGQIYQGRVRKGLVFFLGLYLLFFYGQWMGEWKNVWLPRVPDMPDVVIFGYKLEGVAKSLAYRPQFLAQFWIGVAAWPAVIQYVTFTPDKDRHPMLGKYQRSPSEDELNTIQRRSSKRWDLGWVYTVIAGILNLLVIYDALAGPMFRDPPAAVQAASDAASGSLAATPGAATVPPPPLPAVVASGGVLPGPLPMTNLVATPAPSTAAPSQDGPPRPGDAATGA